MYSSEAAHDLLSLSCFRADHLFSQCVYVHSSANRDFESLNEHSIGNDIEIRVEDGSCLDFVTSGV
jgi:hypothetical protein